MSARIRVASALPRSRRILYKAVVWLICLLPTARLVEKGVYGGLGANPIEYITLSTGTWTLVWLIGTLSVTPLRRLTGWGWLIRFRRVLGLFAFCYAAAHFLMYVWLDQFFDFPGMVKDVVKRPFITAGLCAFVAMVPLAATSTAASIRRLGGRRWQLLHRLVYVSAAAGAIHFWWKVKADTRTPALFAAVIGALLMYRAIAWASRRSAIQIPDSGPANGKRGKQLAR
jgi:methionine sulfoxide reductase heme-binding subunit